MSNVHSPSLVVENVTFHYDEDDKILENENLAVHGPGLVTILGPNGAGKTTFFKVILGLLKPQTGKIFLNGEEVTGNPVKAGRHAALVPQLTAVRRDLPVTGAEIIEFVLRSRRQCSGKSCKEKLRELVEIVGAENYYKKKLSEMSGGQLQRILIARALATGSSILLLDEPFSGIDPGGREYILDFLRKTSREKLILLTTHDPVLTVNFSKMIVIFNKGIKAYGSPDQIFTLDLLRKAYGSSVMMIERCLHVVG
ncbi:MAG: ATP-binding cassette domain-containing protein [Thermofilum sp.]|jgi:zinc/manganese transport system ATP-binding protein|nr:ATP-binding cassette domain-containing protein [Thermofilum sp.]